MKKTKPKRAWCRALSIATGVVCVWVTTGGGLDAAALALWSNGNLNTGINGPNNVADSSGYTVFDNFSVSKPGWIVTGFDFTDYFVGAADFKSTAWSIWSGDPMTGGTLMAKGSGGAVPTGGCSAFSYCQITVTGISVYLPSGATYYLGLNNTLNNANTSNRGYTDGAATSLGVAVTEPLPLGWEESNGSVTGAVGASNAWTNGTGSGTGGNETAFDISGTLVPEPGTLVLMGLAVVGLGYKRRRRAA